MIFVDSNIFIYIMFEVDKQKHDACLRLFEKAKKGIVALWTTEWVIAEFIWFCNRKGKTRTELKTAVHMFLSTSGLQVRNRSLILEALDLWTDEVDYLDAYNIVILQEEAITSVYTYDKGFDTISSLTRKEP